MHVSAGFVVSVIFVRSLTWRRVATDELE